MGPCQVPYTSLYQNWLLGYPPLLFSQPVGRRIQPTAIYVSHPKWLPGGRAEKITFHEARSEPGSRALPGARWPLHLVLFELLERTKWVVKKV